MKRVLLALAITATAGWAMAQNSAVTKADNARKAGTAEDLTEAITLIQGACEHEKTMEKAKTWYIRGQIFEAVALSEDESIKSIDSEAMGKMVESYSKAKELDKENGTYYTFSDVQLNNAYQFYYSKGVEQFNSDNYEGAINEFEKTLLIFPGDTNAILNIASVASQGELYDVALDNLYQLTELGVNNKQVYGSIMNIERNINKDYNKALDVARKAIEKFEGDNDMFKKEEINLLILTEQADDAIAKIEGNIADDPDNFTLYYTLAYLYDQMGDEEKAVGNYNAAIERKPDYFEAHYNLGAFYYNKAIELNKVKNNLGISKEDLAKAKELEVQVKEEFLKAEPAFLKAHDIMPEDKSVIETLQVIYGQTRQYEKAEAMKAKLDALGGVEEN